MTLYEFVTIAGICLTGLLLYIAIKMIAMSEEYRSRWLQERKRRITLQYRPQN